MPGLSGPRQVIDDPCAACAAPAGDARTYAFGHIRPGRGWHPNRLCRRSAPAAGGVARRSGGDLYIFLSLAQHEFFQRDGADLHCRVPISMATAALGGEFEVPAIDGSKARSKSPAAPDRAGGFG